MSGEPKFVVDAMLGGVARWLRLLGYDTVYRKDLADWEILRIAERDGRIVVTRDRGLHRRALKRGLTSIYLWQDDMAERLAHLAATAGIRLSVDLERSRCPLCNGELRKVSKEAVKDKVPRRVYELYSDFWMCTRCGQVYWIGGHWRGIENELSKARSIYERNARSPQT
ncbi:MAG: Mut7-C RNAse domain-containing protein [Desulfurococcaceae archaeon]